MVYEYNKVPSENRIKSVLSDFFTHLKIFLVITLSLSVWNRISSIS